jgi:glutamate-ammonia-ligase adenylyltransferase
MKEAQLDILEEYASKQYQVLIEKHQSEVFYDFEQDIKRAFSLSDFISKTAIQYPEAFSKMLPSLIENASSSSPSYQHSSFNAELEQRLSMVSLEPQLHSQIRQFRHLNMLRIAWLDMLSDADFNESLDAISELANVCINQALSWLYHKTCLRYGHPEDKQCLLVLGMGKLGGNELNFSSDIDLIFVYPSHGETDHPRKPVEHQVFFMKLAQKLIAALHQTTVDGQAYRVDMRLRPLGESGPLVVSLPAFELYYQEQGRDWERFAMQKARIINTKTPDNAAYVKEIEDIIKPFVYRKYLDFTTLESLRIMKQLIENEVKRRGLSDNIKLGAGGIREVEFFVQCHQLIHAGRITECQLPPLYKAMHALVQHDVLDRDIASELLEHYTLLRKVEHFLQAFKDEQTQTLPNNDIGKQRLCVLLQCVSYEDCSTLIKSAMSSIHRAFKGLIEANSSAKQAPPTQSIFTDLWQLDIGVDEASDLLAKEMPQQTATSLIKKIQDVKIRLSKVGLGDKGKHTLQKLIPALIEQCITYNSEQESLNSNENKLQILQTLFELIIKISGRTTYLELLSEHKNVRERLIYLFTQSKWVAQQIINFPLLLDELLHPAYLTEDDKTLESWRDEFENALRIQLLRIEPGDTEAQMDALRYFKITQQLRIAAADLSGHLPVNKVSDKLTLLAETLLSASVELAWQQVSKKFGEPSDANQQDKRFGIIAYGKMGGWEMSYGSDIDMVCIHESDKSGVTDGGKQISNTEFYVKLVQRISHLFTSKTYLGELYELDLRLRPSGNSGLLVTHLDTFKEYQQHKAWTWEHQALTRSRFVFGSDSLRMKFDEARHQIIVMPRDEAQLKQDVMEMRSKMRSHLDKSEDKFIDLKQSKGGITDLEFLVQFLMLKHAHQHSELSTWSDNLRILDTLAACKIIDNAMSIQLQSAYLAIRNKTHSLALQDKKLCASNDPVLQNFEVINGYYDLFLAG